MTTMPNRLYLAGLMSGIAEYNRPLFSKVAEWLRRRGHEVFNPGENKDGAVKQQECVVSVESSDQPRPQDSV